MKLTLSILTQKLTVSTYNDSVQSMRIKNNKAAHHHGDLREALINAGVEILATDGTTALSLRKCAAKAGVSHAAPANHFNGLISLKVAIAARAHRRFAETMQAHMDAAEPDARAQLVGICDGYIAFAQQNRALFGFMFQFMETDFSEIDELSLQEKFAAGDASYGLLRQACAPFAHVDGQTINTETMLWSLVHGYAMLFSADMENYPAGQKPPNFDQILPELPVA